MKLTWANRITILRILLIVPFVSCMLKINDPAFGEQTRLTLRYIAVAIFMIMAISDCLDGFLARLNSQATKLGAFLDPTADKLPFLIFYLDLQPGGLQVGPCGKIQTMKLNAYLHTSPAIDPKQRR